MLHARITGWDVRFHYCVLYSDIAGKPHVRSVRANTPAEALCSVPGNNRVVLFEEAPTEFSEGDLRCH